MAVASTARGRRASTRVGAGDSQHGSQRGPFGDVAASLFSQDKAGVIQLRQKNDQRQVIKDHDGVK